MKKLLKNKIKCRVCGDVIESTHVHDYKQCKCGSCAVDGGLEYARRTFDPNKGSYFDVIEDLSVWEGDEDE